MQCAAQQHSATREPPTKASKRCEPGAFYTTCKIQRKEKQGITTQQAKGKSKTQAAVQQAGWRGQLTSESCLTEHIRGLNSSFRIGCRDHEVGVVVGNLAHPPIIGMLTSCPFRVCYADCKRGVTALPCRALPALRVRLVENKALLPRPHPNPQATCLAQRPPWRGQSADHCVHSIRQPRPAS